MIAYITIISTRSSSTSAPSRCAGTRSSWSRPPSGAFIFAGQLRRKGIEPGHVTAMLVVVVPSALRRSAPFSVLDNWSYYSTHLLAIVVKPPYCLASRRAHRRPARPWRHPLPREEAPRAARAGLPRPGHPGRPDHRVRSPTSINGDTWGAPTAARRFVNHRMPCCRKPARRADQLGLRAARRQATTRSPIGRPPTTLKTDGMAILLDPPLLFRPLLHLVLPGQQHHRALACREAQIVALVVLVAVGPAAWLLHRQAQQRAAAVRPAGHQRFGSRRP